MSGAPLVAVVTPVYNGDPWLERTLANVQLQTYPNLVHVVLDNASTDGTAATIARFLNSRIPLITQRNATVLPQAVNWNAAFALAPREAVYLKLNCADDLMRPDAIEKLVALAETDPEIDFVSAIDVFGDAVQPVSLDVSQPVFPGRALGRGLLLGEVEWISYNHVFFRAAPSFAQAPFDVELASNMDKELVLARLLNRKVGFVFEPLFYTHFDANTVTAVLGGSRAPLVHCYREVVEHGPRFLTEADMKTALRRRKGAVLRHLFTWFLQGDLKNCALAYQVLNKTKSSATVIDFAGAVLEWPRYKADMWAARRGRKAVRAELRPEHFMTPMPLETDLPALSRVSG